MENFIRNTASRAKLVIFLVFALVVSGVYVYRNTPAEQFPEVELPVVLVQSSYYQASSADISEAIIEPLSEKLELLEDLDRSQATAYPGTAIIVLYFDVDTDLNEKLDLVRNAVESVDLPDNSHTSVLPLNLSREALLFAVTSDENRKLYTNEVKTIKRGVLDIDGVSGVRVLGGRKNSIVITADPNQLITYNIEPSAIKNAVLLHKAVVPVGYINNPGGTIAINLKKAINEVEDFNKVVLFSGLGGRKLFLSDVADVAIVDVDENETRINDLRGNIFIVEAEAGIDMRELIVQTKQTIVKLSETMGLEVTILEDSYKNVEDQLEGVLSTVVSTLFLIIIFGTFILGIIDGLLVGITIPLSFLITILFLNIYGYTINFPVLFGVLFAAGMVVDSSIVIIEWGATKIRKGVSYTSAFYDSAIEMSSPILISVLTTLAAFLPLFFMPGIFGKLLRPVPITAATILVSSLIVSFLFIPALGRYFHEVRSFIAAPQSRRGQAFIDGYASLIKLIISKFSTTLITSTFVFLFLIGSLGSYIFFGRPAQFIDDIDSQILQVEISSEEVVSTEEEMAILQQTKDKIALLLGDEITNYRTGRGASAAQSDNVTSIGSVFLYLNEWKDRRPSKELVADLEQLFADLPEEENKIEYRVITENSAPVRLDSRIDVNIYAPTVEALQKASAGFANFLRNEESVENFQTVGPPETLRYNLSPYFNELSFHRITPMNISEYAMMYTDGYEIGTHLLDGDEIPITIRVPKEMRTLADLKQSQLISKAGATGFAISSTRRGAGGQIPLLSLSEESYDKTDQFIMFQDGKTSKNFRILLKKDQVPAFIPKIIPWLKGEHDYDASFKFAGTEKEKSTMLAWLMKSFAFTLVLILFTLLLLFNSFYQAFLILSSVLFSVAGVGLGLTILGIAPSVMMTGMGLIFLAGIVVNNNIILVDRYNKLLKANTEPSIRDAQGIQRNFNSLVIAVGDRFRPIIFTTITTILGVLPAALAISLDIFSLSAGIGDPGIVWYQDLAIAIVLGLSVATFITLLGTPTLLALGIYLQRFATTAWKRMKAKF